MKAKIRAQAGVQKSVLVTGIKGVDAVMGNSPLEGRRQGRQQDLQVTKVWRWTHARE